MLFGADEGLFHPALEAWCKKAGLEHAGRHLNDVEAACALVDASEAGSHKIGIVTERTNACLTFPRPRHKLAAGTIQDFLDDFLRSHPGVGIDYIHGTESLVALARKRGNLGLYLPPIDKGSFFATVVRDGAMPRKTFSMGEAPEKRFYIEARRISL